MHLLSHSEHAMLHFVTALHLMGAEHLVGNDRRINAHKMKSLSTTLHQGCTGKLGTDTFRNAPSFMLALSLSDYIHKYKHHFPVALTLEFTNILSIVLCCTFSSSNEILVSNDVNGDTVPDRHLCWNNEDPKDHLKSSKWTLMIDWYLKLCHFK